MNITIVHRHFWPEPLTYALLLRDLGAALLAEGHSVTVITVRTAEMATRPEGELDGLTVVRVPLLSERRSSWVRRIANTAWYLTAMPILLALRRKVDVVLVATTPPVFPAWLVSWVCRFRGASFIYHYQDLHPESLASTGILRSPWMATWMKRLDTASTRRAGRRVVLSGDMAAALRARPGCGSLDVDILNNYDPVPPSHPGEAGVVDLPGGGKRLLFAGNLGLLQGLDRLVDAVVALGDQEGLSLTLVGDGAAKSSLVRRAGPMLDRTVFFLDRCTPERASAYMDAADFGVISLIPGVIRYAYPSKAAAYLSARLPMLALVDPDSELARLIEGEHIGVTCSADDPGAIEAALLRAARWTPEMTDVARERCSAVARDHFCRSRTLSAWTGLFREIECDRIQRS